MDAAQPPSKRRRTGGIRQRLKRVEADREAQVNVTSGLATHLIEQFSLGHMSPQQVQHLASLAVKDMEHCGGVAPVHVKKLASLGGSGSHAQNMHKELLGFVEPWCLVAKPFQVLLPFKDDQWELQSILLPHEHFSSLYESYPNAFFKSFLPDAEDLDRFWRHALEHPSLKEHPWISPEDENSWSKLIPLAIHGDGVPTTGIGKIWTKTMTSVSYSSLLSGGTGAEAQHYIWSVSDKERGVNTLHEFWEVTQWSSTWLAAGVWPDRDYLGTRFPKGSPARQKAGTALAGGWRASLFAIQGDLEYLNYGLGLARWSRLESPCTLCQATGGNDENTWLDFRLNAAWAKLAWDPKKWKESLENACALFQIPGVSCQ